MVSQFHIPPSLSICGLCLQLWRLSYVNNARNKLMSESVANYCSMHVIGERPVAEAIYR
jgi:hypothetical protein